MDYGIKHGPDFVEFEEIEQALSELGYTYESAQRLLDS